MDQLDPYDQYSIPPDPPTKLDAIEIIRNAAENNPQISRLLDRVASPVEHLRVRIGVRQALANGHPGVGEIKAAVELRKEREVVEKQTEQKLASIGKMTDQLADLSSKRKALLQRIQEMNHRVLLMTALKNNTSYQLSKEEVMKKTIDKLTRSVPASLSEAEKMLEAAQFDGDSDKEVNLDRIIEHRDSITRAIKDITARDTAKARELAVKRVDPASDKRQAEMQNMNAQIKLEIIEKVKETEAEKATLEQLRKLLPDNPSEAAKARAMSDVHAQLVQIMDGLLSKADAMPSSDLRLPAEDVSEAELATLTRKAAEAVGQLRLSITNSAGSTPKIDTTSIKEKLKRLKTLQEKSLKPSDRWKLFTKNRPAYTDTPERCATNAIVTQARKIRDLEIKKENEVARRGLATLTASRERSSALLFERLKRVSLESPLLADIEVRHIGSLDELMQVWVERSARRKEDVIHGFESRAREVERDLAAIRSRIAESQAFKVDLEALERHGSWNKHDLEKISFRD